MRKPVLDCRYQFPAEGSPRSNCAKCVWLADRRHGLSEGVRGLLEAALGTIFMVADEASLLDGVGRLAPSVTIVDLALPGGEWLQLLRALRGGTSRAIEACSPSG